MNQTILYYSENNDKLPLSLMPDNYNIIPSCNQNELIQTLLSQTDIKSIIVNDKNFPELMKRLEILKQFNPCLQVIIYNKNKKLFTFKDSDQLITKSIFKISLQNMEKLLQNTKENKRKNYRIDWLLNAFFSNTRKISIIKPVSILNVSAGGAYIKSDSQRQTLKKNIILKIPMQNFQLMTEAKIVGIYNQAGNPECSGFNVAFQSITEKTRDYFKEIITKKILQEIFSD